MAESHNILPGKLQLLRKLSFRGDLTFTFGFAFSHIYVRNVNNPSLKSKKYVRQLKSYGYGQQLAIPWMTGIWACCTGPIEPRAGCVQRFWHPLRLRRSSSVAGQFVGGCRICLGAASVLARQRPGRRMVGPGQSSPLHAEHWVEFWCLCPFSAIHRAARIPCHHCGRRFFGHWRCQRGLRRLWLRRSLVERFCLGRRGNSGGRHDRIRGRQHFGRPTSPSHEHSDSDESARHHVLNRRMTEATDSVPQARVRRPWERQHVRHC